MPRPIRPLLLTSAQESALRRVAERPKASQREARRAHIVLLRAEGLSQQETAHRLGVQRSVVGVWERRFAAHGLAGLEDAKGRGRQPGIPEETRAEILTRATRPPEGRTRWSVRSMAQAAGVSKATVQRLWSANDIKPHRTKTFKLSNDPHFEETFWDVIGLYFNPPDKALVLCCDEKSQCQALERTQPGLPLGIGHIRTHTHDYIRHGTVTLCAALNYLEGKIISRTEEKHTHVEWLRFLKQIDREVPKELGVHIIADNYATHKKQEVRDWLALHPRFVMHFTPTGSSWMNLVERFFADLTGDCIREGSFGSVAELTRAIEAYLAERNLHPKPYRWKAKGQEILEKIQRARAALQKNSND